MSLVLHWRCFFIAGRIARAAMRRRGTEVVGRSEGGPGLSHGSLSSNSVSVCATEREKSAHEKRRERTAMGSLERELGGGGSFLPSLALSFLRSLTQQPSIFSPPRVAFFSFQPGREKLLSWVSYPSHALVYSVGWVGVP